MNALASAMNLNRFSTYNLACELKDQIQEVERNWDADIQQLERAKRARGDMQEKVRLLQILLHQEREATANLEKTLRESKFELENPDLDTSFDSYALYEEGNSFSSASVYSDSDFCLVYNPSAASDTQILDNPANSVLVAERDHSGSHLELSETLADPTQKSTRSAQWKQLIASFLPNAKEQHSLRPSLGSTSSVLRTITSSRLNTDRFKRRTDSDASFPNTSDAGSERTDINDWRDSAEAAGGRFTRRKTTQRFVVTGRPEDV
jgi:hypothetical protein